MWQRATTFWPRPAPSGWDHLISPTTEPVAETVSAVGEHDKPKPDPDPNDDGRAPGVPPEPDPGKHGKK